MNCKSRLKLTILITGLAGAATAGIITFDEVKPERIGEFVTLSGSVTAFHPPPEPRAPMAFSIGNSSQQTMRVVIWPDIFERIDNRELLKSPGTSVTLTAEVAEYNESLELHLQDWEEIEVQAGADVTSTSTDTSESTASHENLWWSGEITSGTGETSPLQTLKRYEDLPGAS